MHVHTVGVGAIGCLVTHHLRGALPPSNIITIIRNSSRGVAAFTKHFNGMIHVAHDGIRRSANGFRSTIPNPSVSKNPLTRQMPEDHIDTLLMTTRTYTTLAMLSMLRSRLTRSSTIILLQHGMGMHEDILYHFFPDPSDRPHFILATHSHHAYLQGFGDVVHTRIGDIQFGVVPNDPDIDADAGFYDESLTPFDRKGRLEDIKPVSPEHKPRVESLRNSVGMLLELRQLNTSWLPMADLQTILRKRLVVQALVDSLTTLFGCNNGALLTNPQGESTIKKYCHEASRIFGKELAAATTYSAKVHGSPQKHILPRPLLAHELEKAVIEHIKSTKPHISSMLSDVRLSKPTENKYLNGHLLRLSSKYQVDAPTISMLSNLVSMRSNVPLDLNYAI